MTDSSLRHTPVMVSELLEQLDLKQSHTVIDATFGFGGHARVVLEELGSAGRLVGFERDPEVFERVRTKFDDPRLTLVNENYRRMDECLPGDVEEVNAVYFDLGVSSYHFDTSDRGFSFRRDEDPLDFRFNPDEEIPEAASVLNNVDLEELRNLLQEYGEVRHLGSVTRSILDARPLRIVRDLREAVEQAVPYKDRKGELSRVFQALRIYVNEELESLEDGLEKALDLVVPGGKIAVISYHSLEDRRVKEFFRYQSRECICPPDLPVCACDKVQRCVVDDRSPMQPGEEEVGENPRARSAILRAATVVSQT